MSPGEYGSTGIGHTTRTSKQKTIKSFFTSYKCETQLTLPHSACSLPEPPKLSNHTTTPSHRKLRQTTLFSFLTPQSSNLLTTPSAPIKLRNYSQVPPGGQYNLLADFTLTFSQIPNRIPLTSTFFRQQPLRQTTLRKFFHILPCSSSHNPSTSQSAQGHTLHIQTQQSATSTSFLQQTTAIQYTYDYSISVDHSNSG